MRRAMRISETITPTATLSDLWWYHPEYLYFCSLGDILYKTQFY